MFKAQARISVDSHTSDSDNQHTPPVHLIPDPKPGRVQNAASEPVIFCEVQVEPKYAYRTTYL
jgi:hypothetical protein